MQRYLDGNLDPAAIVASTAITQTDIRAPLKIDARRIWNKEYGGEVSIPSSLRSNPSHALLELCKHFKLPQGKALDLGCGNGRNSFLLANQGMDVTAIDFSEVALGLLTSSSNYLTSHGSITTLNHDIEENLPFEDSHFDLILDSYCLCHFTEVRIYKKILNECARVLKKTGLLVQIHLDNLDKYYLERVERTTEFGHVSYDPANNLKKLHYSVTSYLRYFAENFELQTILPIEFVDNVRGKNYVRSIFVSVIKKKT